MYFGYTRHTAHVARRAGQSICVRRHHFRRWHLRPLCKIISYHFDPLYRRHDKGTITTSLTCCNANFALSFGRLEGSLASRAIPTLRGVQVDFQTDGTVRLCHFLLHQSTQPLCYGRQTVTVSAAHLTPPPPPPPIPNTTPMICDRGTTFIHQSPAEGQEVVGADLSSGASFSSNT